MEERTLAIIKPDAVKRELIGPVLEKMENDGFKIKGLKMVHLSRQIAEAFYEVHRGKDFYPGLIDFMTEGPSVVVVLEKENAIQDYRHLMGNTDPAKAEEDTIRHQFAQDMRRNAVHGSDSRENAEREISFFFSAAEMIRH